jgi:hypothetical protein
MHDGRFATLQEVIDFYNSGVQDNPSLDQGLRNPLQLNLTPQQVQQLVAYLETLTDETFLTSELFSDPFVTLPGDYDGSGEVDMDDYEVWQSNVGSAGALAADGNGDSVIDAADFVVWQKNFGRTWLSLGAGGAMTASSPMLPEPSGMAAAAVAAMWCFGMRNQRRPRGAAGGFG